MPGSRLYFQCVSQGEASLREIVVERLVIAGWTGRDRAAMEAHIEELVALGVPRPAATPMFYRVAASLLTTEAGMQVSGDATSGEVEPVVVAAADGLWVTVGSDHTDREAETNGITLAKQLCGKPIAPTLWRLDDVAPHWDDLVLRAHATVDGVRRLYQEGPVSVMRTPADLVARYTGGGATLPSGTAMFCGTMAVHGGIAPAGVFEIELDDPVLERTIRHAYRVENLPVTG